MIRSICPNLSSTLRVLQPISVRAFEVSMLSIKKTNKTHLTRYIRHNVHSFIIEYRIVKDGATIMLMYMDRLLAMPTQI